MPKGWTNKAHGNTLYAHLADIKWAWRTAELTPTERRATLLRHGLDLTYVETGATLGVAKQTAQENVERAVGKLAAHLNGKRFLEAEDADEWE